MSARSAALKKENISGASLIAIAISFLAMAFSGLSWRDSHYQQSLSRRPTVNIDLYDDPQDKKLGLDIVNNGPGLAIIQKVQYYVDQNPVNNLYDALEKQGFVRKRDHGWDLEIDDSISAGSSISIMDYRPQTSKEASAMTDFLDDHLQVKVNYCNISGDECRSRCEPEEFCRQQP